MLDFFKNLSARQKLILAGIVLLAGLIGFAMLKGDVSLFSIASGN